jgi:hypothetical protein
MSLDGDTLMHVLNPRKIKRKLGCVVVPEREKKE